MKQTLQEKSIDEQKSDLCLIAEIQQTYWQNIYIFICQTVFTKNLNKSVNLKKSNDCLSRTTTCV